MNSFVVYNDTRKLGVITASYAIMAVVLVALGLNPSSNAVLLGCAIVLAALLALGIASNVGRMCDRSPLFVLTEHDVTDYTKKDDVLTLPWSQVLSVQLKAANSNDLMLDIMGYKTVDQLEVVTPEMRAQLDQSGTDRVYYLLELSGLWVRRARIKEAFEWARDNARDTSPELVFADYKDPLSKVGGGQDNPLFEKRRLKRFWIPKEQREAERAAAKAWAADSGASSGDAAASERKAERGA